MLLNNLNTCVSLNFPFVRKIGFKVDSLWIVAALCKNAQSNKRKFIKHVNSFFPSDTFNTFEYGPRIDVSFLLSSTLEPVIAVMFHLTTLTPRKYEQIRNLLFQGIFWWIYNFSRKVRRNKYEILRVCTNTNAEILWGIRLYQN